jgi:hypothetical protein
VAQKGQKKAKNPVLLCFLSKTLSPLKKTHPVGLSETALDRIV